MKKNFILVLTLTSLFTLMIGSFYISAMLGAVAFIPLFTIGAIILTPLIEELDHEAQMSKIRRDAELEMLKEEIKAQKEELRNLLK